MFKMTDRVEATVEDLIKLVNLCVTMDRIEKPERIDYGEYVMSFLCRSESEIDEMGAV